jgi:hypothetical protein
MPPAPSASITPEALVTAFDADKSDATFVDLGHLFTPDQVTQLKTRVNDLAKKIQHRGYFASITQVPKNNLHIYDKSVQGLHLQNGDVAFVFSSTGRDLQVGGKDHKAGQDLLDKTKSQFYDNGKTSFNGVLKMCDELEVFVGKDAKFTTSTGVAAPQHKPSWTPANIALLVGIPIVLFALLWFMLRPQAKAK